MCHYSVRHSYDDNQVPAKRIPSEVKNEEEKSEQMHNDVRPRIEIETPQPFTSLIMTILFYFAFQWFVHSDSTKLNP